MAIIDNAAAIRERAYEIWQREGCPSGREHEHWAEANAEFAALASRESADRPAPERRPGVVVNNVGDLDRIEGQRMREALWTPEPFEVELFGGESPALTDAMTKEQRLAG